MKRALTLIVLGGVIVIAVLAVLNWATLMQPAPLDLGFTQLVVPLGALTFGLAALLATLLLLSLASHAIGSLLHERRANERIKRLQELADTAETSRIESLRQLVTAEFARLHERLGPGQPQATVVELDPETRTAGPIGFFARRSR